MPEVTQNIKRFEYRSDPVAVATPHTVDLPNNISNVTVVISTDVAAGAGTIAVDGSVVGSPWVNPAAGAISLAMTGLSVVLVNIGPETFDRLRFTPAGITTATTYKVHIIANKS